MLLKAKRHTMKTRSIMKSLLLMAWCAGACVVSSCGDDDDEISPVENSGGSSSRADTKEYVDLDLPSGTLWATCNVGASSPEESGDYFAWGETTPKDDYGWSTYKWCKGSSSTMTKYCTNKNSGTVDKKAVLEPEDDAATANWGSEWQTPSLEQLQELCNDSYTTTTWTTQNGVNGCKITSNSNGNSIFLPAAGYRNDTRFFHAGGFGFYWSRSLRPEDGYTTTDSRSADGLDFDADGIYRSSYCRRYYGQSIRPVHVDNK